ncbi:MAG: glycosyltransferase family 2 protein [Ginsengibacter sp.]
MEGLVSVIIPTYDRSTLLKEAIESVIAQTYRPIECIVVDDGSTDDTKKVVEEIGNTVDKNFKLVYIFQENSGSQVARNTGTKESSGDFIQYLDSDDLLYPEKLEKQVLFLNEHLEVDGVFGDWEMGIPGKKDFIEAWDSEDMITQLLMERIIVNFSFLMRREIINKIGEWDINIKRNQEIDFQVRGLLAGANYIHQSQTCGLWRIHSGERIANTTGVEDFLNFFNKWENKLSEKGLFTDCLKNKIANTFLWLAWENKKNITGKNGSLNLLQKAVRLNPEIPFANSKKMKILRKFLPLKSSIQLWWLWAKRNAHIQATKHYRY